MTHDYLFELLGVRDRLVMDPVHGGITLFRHEIEVIDHPLFQRLRHICQNDILSLVFPGATHSRFLHSIGTLHVGGRMFLGLMESSLRRHRDRKGDLTANQLQGISHLGKMVRLACLLHDCGHSSFSHQFSQSDTIRRLLAQPGRFDRLWEGLPHLSFYSKPLQHLEHEHYSVRCAYEILYHSNNQQLIDLRDDVMALLDTTVTRPSETFKETIRTLWPVLTGSQAIPQDAAAKCLRLLASIVSGEVDADRADYMLRDGFHSSVTLGGFNLDHLLKNMHVGWSAGEDWMGLGITLKGLGALEDFVYSRYQMYRKVYGHKTSIGFDWLLRQAIDEVLSDPDSLAYVDRCLSDMRQFQTLTDNFFWESFRRLAENKPDSCSFRLVYRQRLHHLKSAENLAEQEITALRQDLARQMAVPTDQLICCKMKARFSRIQPGFRSIRVFQDGKYQDISECSGFFSKFQDQTICHFYQW